MPRFKTIAFFTKGTPYAAEACELVESGKKFGIDVEIVGYPNQGEWVRNAALKSTFILDMMEKYPNEEWLLYVDADARFRQYPKLFDTFEGDLGVHYRRGSELLSGTIFIHNTFEMQAFVKSWIITQGKNPTKWDQKVLQHCIETSNINVVKLPAAYTQIFDSMASFGDPVIEHMQASRRLRKIIGKVQGITPKDSIPKVLGRVRVRRGYDGTYYITRKDPVAEAYLDKRCSRMVNQLRWFPYLPSQDAILDLCPLFDKKGCYIIGKGPSLDNIREEHFPNSDAPIIALNESVHAVEKLNLPNAIFALQQDSKLQDACYPTRGKLFVSIKAANWYAECERVYIFDSRYYKLNLNALSVSVAVKLAKSLGTNHFTLVCFDACVNGNLKYAKAITDISHDVLWGGSLTRFSDHRARIEQRLGSTPATWVIPKVIVGLVSGRPRQ